MDKTQYKHIRFSKPRNIRAVTIAVATDEKGKIFIGASVCSTKDNFCKRKGRLTAKDRLDAEVENYNMRLNKNREKKVE